MATELDDSAVVVPRQNEISVFANQLGGVTIKMEQDDGYGSQPSEVLITVALPYVDALIAAIQKAKREAMED